MDRIGRYIVEGELGRGGCGIVYLGRDLKMNRHVAIKTILTRELQNSAGGQELQARLTREAQSAGSVNHPSIVTVYELAEENELTFFVMEYVDGPPLDTVMGKGPIPWPRLIQILREIAAGLDFAHSKGIIHRDIKPSNILISSAGHAKISDFGVAKILEAASMTTTGMAVGTPAYMSPEQILTKPLDGRSDQFSLAVIAFEMLTGRKPFQADSLPGLIHQILSVEPPSATEINAEVSEPAASILRRALAKEASARYGGCVEFVSALEAALLRGEGAIQPAPAATPQPIEIKAEKQPPPSSGNLVRAILFLALGLAVAGYFYSQRTRVEVAGPAAAKTGETPQAGIETGAGEKKVEAPLAGNGVRPGEKAGETTAAGSGVRPGASDPAVKGASAKAEKKAEAKAKTAEVKPAAPVATPAVAPAQAPDPGPDQPASSYMGSPEGRFSWSGTLPAGERLIIVRNRVRMGTIAGNGLPAGVAVQVETRPADIRVMQQPAASNGFRLIVVNQSGHDVPAFTVLWREQSH
ncbi:MAG: serine/threonine protein kinase [Bryobacterales bacterium]|nr:serine/threonine protein kinase [Bryobacterales bacterium]